jgi:ubiquinone/menaquinone biosynthesis C-methylase UbiE
MARSIRWLLPVLGLVVVASLAWRMAARVRALPCPPWLGGFLQNPLSDRLVNHQMLRDRLGLRPGMRVLDAGSGPGRLTLPAAELVSPGGEVVALDIQPAMLQRLEERLADSGIHNVRTVLGGLGDGVLDQNAFDRAMLVTVLGEIPDQERALREIYGALLPGGILAVTEMLPDPHFQRQSAVRRMAESVGFRLEQGFGNPLAYTMHLVKPHTA